jgi:hypothetical protein
MKQTPHYKWAHINENVGIISLPSSAFLRVSVILKPCFDMNSVSFFGSADEGGYFVGQNIH